MTFPSLAALIFLFGTSAAASAAPADLTSDWNGTWQGQGIVDRDSLDHEVTATYSLTLQTTAEAFDIKECWNTTEQSPEGHSCMSSHYAVRNDGEIWFRNRKIGDIFADRIVLLDANSQVSEQMIFDRNGSGQIRYQYSYANLDGGSAHRKAILTKTP